MLLLVMVVKAESLAVVVGEQLSARRRWVMLMCTAKRSRGYSVVSSELGNIKKQPAQRVWVYAFRGGWVSPPLNHYSTLLILHSCDQPKQLHCAANQASIICGAPNKVTVTRYCNPLTNPQANS